MAGKTEYTQKTADLICDLIVEGKSVRTICGLKEMPCMSTVFKWLRDNEAFSQQYARAKQAQAHQLADEMFSISDDATGDVSGELQMPNGVAVQRARLMVDTRKWYLSKLLPKIYGDKLIHAGDEDNPIAIKRVISDL